jgi:hypothetical protein
MGSKDMINKRIMDEIDRLKADNDVKQFLKEILLYELDIIDQGRPVFRDKYVEIINKIF